MICFAIYVSMHTTFFVFRPVNWTFVSFLRIDTGDLRMLW